RRAGTSKVFERRFSDREYVESQFEKPPMIQNISSVENEGGLEHGGEYPLIVQFLVHLPFRHHRNGMGPGRSGVGIGFEGNPRLDIPQILLGMRQSLGIGDDDFGPLVQKPA